MSKNNIAKPARNQIITGVGKSINLPNAPELLTNIQERINQATWLMCVF